MDRQEEVSAPLRAAGHIDAKLPPRPDEISRRSAMLRLVTSIALAGCEIGCCATAITLSEKNFQNNLHDLQVGLLQGEDIAPLIESIDVFERSKYVGACRMNLDSFALNTFFGQQLWHANAYLISLLDPEHYYKYIHPSVMELLKSETRFDTRWEDLAPENISPHAALNFSRLHGLFGLVVPEGRQILLEAIHSAELEIRTHFAGRLSEIIESVLLTAQAIEQERYDEAQVHLISAADESDPLWEKLRSAIDTSGQFKLLRGTLIIASYLCQTGEQWEVVPCGVDDDLESVMIRCLQEPQRFRSVSPARFIDLVSRGEISVLLEEADANYHSQIKDHTVVSDFDFPAAGRISHLRVFAHIPESNLVIAGDMYASILRSMALEKRYGLRLHTESMIITPSPMAALGEQVERLYKSGTTYFYIELSAHGDSDGIMFRQRVTATDLIEFAKRFPNCSFAFSTFACFGGGIQQDLATQLRADPKTAKRLTFFSHAPLDHVNYVPSATSVSLFNLYLIQGWLNPNLPTFGSCFEEADIHTREQTPLDAKAVINGKALSYRNKNSRWPPIDFLQELA